MYCGSLCLCAVNSSLAWLRLNAWTHFGKLKCDEICVLFLYYSVSGILPSIAPQSKIGGLRCVVHRQFCLKQFFGVFAWKTRLNGVLSPEEGAKKSVKKQMSSWQGRNLEHVCYVWLFAWSCSGVGWFGGIRRWTLLVVGVLTLSGGKFGLWRWLRLCQWVNLVRHFLEQGFGRGRKTQRPKSKDHTVCITGHGWATTNYELRQMFDASLCQANSCNVVVVVVVISFSCMCPLPKSFNFFSGKPLGQKQCTKNLTSNWLMGYKDGNNHDGFCRNRYLVYQWIHTEYSEPVLVTHSSTMLCISESFDIRTAPPHTKGSLTSWDWLQKAEKGGRDL